MVFGDVKCCRKCQKVLDVSKFYKNRFICKDCYSKQKQKKEKKNPKSTIAKRIDHSDYSETIRQMLKSKQERTYNLRICNRCGKTGPYKNKSDTSFMRHQRRHCRTCERAYYREYKHKKRLEKTLHEDHFT